MGFRVGLAAALLGIVAFGAEPRRSEPKTGFRGWSVYGGSPENIRYSALSQINRENADKLRVAWTFDTGDAFNGSEMQCNPLIAHGILYATTPKLNVVALDASAGKLLWRFDPNEALKLPVTKERNRGLTWWENGTDRRVFFVSRHFLYALDARTGKPDASFGRGGYVDLREGLGRPVESVYITATTPGVVYKDLLIIGSLVSEALPAAPGDIRAYDVRTGKLRWSFHTIPHPGEPGYDTWPKDAWTYSGGANSWSGLSLDTRRGLVFAGTGSASFDFYGANRLGDDLFANCVLALNAETGKHVWHFQAVKHDVWDRDFPAPPALVTVMHDGHLIDAVAQITKSGYVFVLDRETGKPLFPVEFRSVPASDVDGEVTAKMQLFPLKPPPFARQAFTEDLVTNRTPEAHAAVLARLRKLRSGGQFTPPSLQGTVVFPGFDGGGEWGGPAFDPATGMLYVNANEMAWVLRLVPKPKSGAHLSGSSLYARNCASCHRADRRGSPPEFPSLVKVGEKYDEREVGLIIRNGSGRMPAFTQLPSTATRAIARYLMTGEDLSVAPAQSVSSPADLKYGIDGYNKFLDPDGYPAVKPPWGTLNAIDLDKGTIVWKIPFGEYPELVAKGMRNTGSENYGGPLVTAGGLLFIGATDRDRKFHVFDKRTGKLLWETELPASGNATPATYEVNGRQFVVIAAGGGKSGSPSGGSYVAFALPTAH
jgi:quinoprotein glucose dehydrogenase